VPCVLRSSVQQSEVLEFTGDDADGVRGVLGPLPASDDDFPRPEQQRDDVGFVEPVDKPGELLGLVLDVLQPQPDGDSGQLQVAP
jgi:hypothetical protein